ncbi:NAD(P)/FAD-dependent oxidoreductase [Lysinibacillus antri]|uniref:FAD-binding oxidoreductase n=1 Tax=Lysinibacillus antri TaxID=2498145 RepID=A0A432L6S4_9BACI|nr:FAD-dependent oxidoreductase [Lysinibacillus antri]RUL46484.1 FAD-binding oxidoreductase [Lysinibacillus antri]
MKQKVVVIGAGIIGTAVAYYLSKQNVEVILVEAKDIAAGTSGACDKAIMLQSKKVGPALDLAIQSAMIYKELEQELQQDLEYHNGGGMILIENQLELNVLQERVKQQQAVGLKVKLLSGEEIRRKNPHISKNILAATWCEEDAEINPMHTAFAFAKAAYKNNVQIHLHSEVVELIIRNNQIQGVQTTNGAIYADSVILCSGVWTKHLLNTIDLDIPIKPRKGVILVTEKLPRMIDCNILSGAYLAAKLQIDNDPSTVGVGLAISQTKSGTLLIGGSREFVGFDPTVKGEIIRAIAKRAVAAFPILEHTNLIRSFAGFRPHTPDNLPILSDIPSIHGLFIAAGHEGDGVALAPITGQLAAKLVTRQNIDVDLTPYRFDRFSTNTVS